MPFYEYHCANCGHHHEELQKITDKPLRKCPACGKSKLHRLISAPVFRLKGGGWYETDFKSDKESKRNLAGEKEPPPKADATDKPKAEPVKPDKPEKKESAVKPSAVTKKPVRRKAAKKAAPKAAGRRR